ncbi:hypothetical protein Sjap_001490 [Stephania japonica]|uniref:Uncharacterized protein n=1 Tax=Stephania japonica TaxID=461633 RepID=A0AAP0KKX9_9MAGN
MGMTKVNMAYSNQNVLRDMKRSYGDDIITVVPTLAIAMSEGRLSFFLRILFSFEGLNQCTTLIALQE